VPHPTTLMKITTRCGSEVIEQLNEAQLCLLAKGGAGKAAASGKSPGRNHRGVGQR